MSRMNGRPVSRKIPILALLALLGAATAAEARPVALSKRFETDKKTGVGLMIGSPTALSAKYFLTSEIAVDLSLGANIVRKRDGFRVGADLLWHPFVAVEGMTFLAPLYFGGGFRYLDHDARAGIRFPVGISFVFDEKPLGLFAEVAVIYDVTMAEEADGVLDPEMAVGVRYYF